MRARFRRNAAIWIFFLFVLVTLAFIFRNSLQNGEQSNAWSSRIAALLQQIFDPGGRLTEVEFHKLIRKLAHFSEFCLLGCSLCWLIGELPDALRRLSVCNPLFLTLACAVTDEFIQSFTGRTSSVRDVLIDFAGALLGIGFAHALRRFWRRTKRGK